MTASAKPFSIVAWIVVGVYVWCEFVEEGVERDDWKIH